MGGINVRPAISSVDGAGHVLKWSGLWEGWRAAIGEEISKGDLHGCEKPLDSTPIWPRTEPFDGL